MQYHHDADELQVFASMLMQSGRVSDALEYVGRAASILESNTNMPVEDNVSFHMNLSIDSMSMTF